MDVGWRICAGTFFEMTMTELLKLAQHLEKVKAAEDENCPVCGYYCIGNGGFGCIDKPEILAIALKQEPPK